MPSVNLTPETYEKLKKIAAGRGCTPDEVAQSALERHVAEAASAWAERWEEIESKSVESLTEDETNFEIDRTVDEVRADAYARRLGKEDLLREWRTALAEVRAGILADASEAELTAEIDAALNEVRADRRARGY